jgi:hypothetical protein
MLSLLERDMTLALYRGVWILKYRKIGDELSQQEITRLLFGGVESGRASKSIGGVEAISGLDVL